MRRLRILVLLGLLAGALGFTWLEQSMARSWQGPLVVELTPINGDGSAATAAYIAGLDAQDFGDINRFLEREIARYGAPVSQAIDLTIKPELKQIPPAPPGDGNVFSTMAWSLKLRTWVYRQSGQWQPQLGTVKLFVLYHLPQDGKALPHSLGLQKGLIGVVHAYAEHKQSGQNAIVIAHELLHTLGATDKYGAGGYPVYPAGVADPEVGEQGAQTRAEIMAGRYVNAAGRLTMPDSLDACVIGSATAHEINLDALFARRFGAS